MVTEILAPSHKVTKPSPPNSYFLKSSEIIDAKVAQIMEVAQNGMRQPHELGNSEDYIDVAGIRRYLSTNGIAEESYLGLAGVALQTEAATNTYVASISRVARVHKAGWLRDFNELVWKPDEAGHKNPYKKIMLGFGYSEGEIDRLEREAEEAGYTHLTDKTPAYVTGYATQQEEETAYIHELLLQPLKDSSPQAADDVFYVKRREGLHMTWYRDMTAIQVLDNPKHISEVARSTMEYEMPDREITKVDSKAIEGWFKDVGGDQKELITAVMSRMERALGSRRNFGEFIIKVGDGVGGKIGPLRVRHLDHAFALFLKDRHTMLGNATLEAAGLPNRLNKDKYNPVEKAVYNWMVGSVKNVFDSMS